MLKTWIKAPSATLDYSIDWSTKGWLQAGETILTAQWRIAAQEDPADEAEPAGCPLAIASSCVTGGTVATVWLSGGEVDTFYLVHCLIGTSQGRQDSRSFQIQCQTR
jgi:hypothetical protein